MRYRSNFVYCLLKYTLFIYTSSIKNKNVVKTLLLSFTRSLLGYTISRKSKDEHLSLQGRSMRSKIAQILMVISLSFGFFISTGVHAYAASSPDAPQISGQATNNTATVTFRSVAKVSGYEVSMSLLVSGTYKVVYLGSQTSTTIKALSVGTPIFLKVRSYISSGSKKTYSDYSSLSLTPSFSAVVLSGKTSKGSNTLSWAKVSGATSYEISSSSSYAGGWKSFDTVEKSDRCD